MSNMPEQSGKNEGFRQMKKNQSNVGEQKQQDRAVKTKHAILQAAKQLFTQRGFQTVTMREIAKKADCSHTLIYMYYKDKMSLLQALAIDPLKTLLTTFQTIQADENDPLKQLKTISLHYMSFAFEYRSMYEIFLMLGAEKVDNNQPSYEINQIRIQLFSILNGIFQKNFPINTKEQSLQSTRIFFYMLHGMIKTYLESDEPKEELIERLTPVLNEGIHVVIAGIRETNKT